MSRKERLLKENQYRPDEFETMVKRLKKDGIFNRKLTGYVISFYNGKGYGFIRSRGKNYFMLRKSIDGQVTPAVGDILTFTVKAGTDRVERAWR